MKDAEDEKEWTCSVYRRTACAGWEQMKALRSTGKAAVIKASPRKGCIVLRRIQVRILLHANTSNKRSSTVEDETHTVVVRRENRILVSSSRHRRALVLRFRSVKDCLEFCDRLNELNPPVLNSTCQEGPRHDNGILQEDVAVAVGRLLHDPEFSKFAAGLEASIAASEDGALLLNALVYEGQEGTDTS
jgi:hypothetical protein